MRIWGECSTWRFLLSHIARYVLLLLLRLWFNWKFSILSLSFSFCLASLFKIRQRHATSSQKSFTNHFRAESQPCRFVVYFFFFFRSNYSFQEEQVVRLAAHFVSCKVFVQESAYLLRRYIVLEVLKFFKIGPSRAFILAVKLELPRTCPRPSIPASSTVSKIQPTTCHLAKCYPNFLATGPITENCGF